MKQYTFIYNKPKRKAFKTSIKKRVWMKAGKHNPDNWRTGFIKTSYCMNPRCKKKLNWDKKYQFQFDHRDNNNTNNRESNCGLLCNDCHRKFTKFGTRIIKFMGVIPLRRERIKKKVGYKKPKKPKKTIRRKRKPKGTLADIFKGL